MKRTSLKLAFTLFAPLAMFGCDMMQNNRVNNFAEIKNALSFANVEYLQADAKYKKFSESYNQHFDLSPTVSYKSNDDKPEYDQYVQKIKKEEDFDYFVYKKDSGGIWHKESGGSDDFVIPRHVSYELGMESALEHCKDYSNYKYADGKYTCEWRDENNSYYRLTFKFLNKRVISVEKIYLNDPFSSFVTATFKYKNYTPTLPHVG